MPGGPNARTIVIPPALWKRARITAIEHDIEGGASHLVREGLRFVLDHGDLIDTLSEVATGEGLTVRELLLEYIATSRE